MATRLSYDMTLSMKAHNYATKKYCETIGLKWKETDSGDVVCYPDDKTSCEMYNSGNVWVDNRWIELPQRKSTTSFVPDTDYREWMKDSITSKDVCVVSNPAVKDFCYRFQDRSGGFGTDPLTGEQRMVGNRSIGYYPGQIKCNFEGGYCENLNNEEPNIQSCIITDDYCRSYNASRGYGPGGLGECYLPGGQRFAESLIGTTFTRAYRESVDRCIAECQDPANGGCYLAAIRIIATPYEFLGDLGQQWYAGIKDQLNDSFNTLYNDPSPYNISKFAETLIDSFPARYYTKLLMDKVSGILDGLVQMIPGLNKIIPDGLFGKLGGFLFAYSNPFTLISLGIKWGPKIWDYIRNFGIDDLKIIGDAVFKFGATVLNALGGFISGLASKGWDLIKKGLRFFTNLPTIVFFSQIGAEGIKALDKVFGSGGYISQLVSGDFNRNIKDFFATQVGQKFFMDWIWKGGLVKAGLAISDAFNDFIRLF